MTPPRAFLFDLDGTLIDSMPHHHDAWVEWRARRGLEMDADGFFASTAGRSNAEILADMFPALGAAEPASTPGNMALAFERHGIGTWVQSVDSPADGLRGKPHPDIFLEAARRAGMAAVALTTTLGASAFSGYPNVCAVHADLATLDPLALIATLAAPTREQHHA